MTLRILLLAASCAIGCTRSNEGTSDGAAVGGGGNPADLGAAGSPADLAGASDPGDLAPGPGGDYGTDGPAGVSTITASVPRAGGAPYNVVIYLPGTPGAHPVVVLSSGLLQAAAGYASYGKRLASWGMIAILRDDPGFSTQTNDVAADVADLVLTWLPSQNGDAASPLHGLVDVTRVGLAGHSRGGQVALIAAEGALKGHVRGVFGLDPVDGSQGGANARATLGAIGVPTAFLGETTDSGATGGGMACAPAADNYQVLYAAASSPSVALTAIGADHTQFEDPAGCMLCTFCTPGTADGKIVLALSVRYLTAFFARELNGDASVGAGFTGAGIAADVSVQHVSIQSK